MPKYFLKRDLPGAKAGTEIFIHKTVDGYQGIWIVTKKDSLAYPIFFKQSEFSDWISTTEEPSESRSRIEPIDATEAYNSFELALSVKINELITAVNGLLSREK